MVQFHFLVNICRATELYKRHPLYKSFYQVRELFSRIKADGRRTTLWLRIATKASDLQNPGDVYIRVRCALRMSGESSKPGQDILKYWMDWVTTIPGMSLLSDILHPYDGGCKVNLHNWVYFVVGSRRKFHKAVACHLGHKLSCYHTSQSLAQVKADYMIVNTKKVIA